MTVRWGVIHKQSPAGVYYPKETRGASQDGSRTSATATLTQLGTGAWEELEWFISGMSRRSPNGIFIPAPFPGLGDLVALEPLPW